MADLKEIVIAHGILSYDFDTDSCESYGQGIQSFVKAGPALFSIFTAPNTARTTLELVVQATPIYPLELFWWFRYDDLVEAVLEFSGPVTDGFAFHYRTSMIVT